MEQPLAIRLRPKKLDEVFGQQHLTGEDMLLRRCVDQQHLFSMIFFGPPGCGKTTLALAIAGELNLPYRFFSAVEGNKKDLTEIFEEAKLSNGLIVVIDEIHRLNKDKQDLLLPHIESGMITVIGATTSNPLFAINPAVRSRCQLLEVKRLTKEDIKNAIKFAVNSERGLKGKIDVDEDAISLIANHANGDLRYAYNLLEICAIGATDSHIDSALVQKYSPIANTSFDHDEDGHYNTVSAFQKSIRGSDVNAALYYLSRLMMANDMDSIERRLTVIAYEDIGLANPAAAARTTAAIDAAKRLGFPEAMIPLSVAVIDLCLSPKSRSADDAIQAAFQTANSTSFDIPEYLKMNPVGLQQGETYDNAWAKRHKLQYLPDELKDIEFYRPEYKGYEKAIADNYAELKKIKRSSNIKEL